jgi:hypothetical protein
MDLAKRYGNGFRDIITSFISLPNIDRAACPTGLAIHPGGQR